MTDYNLIGSASPTDLLIAAGRKIGVLSITQTSPHPFMMTQALKQAQYQADINQIGHQHFDTRAADTIRQFPGCEVSEICAESWSGQSDIEAAEDAYKCWKASPGHWRECNRAHRYYGYAMVKSSAGIWYSCGQFCDDGDNEIPQPMPGPEKHCGWLRRLLGLCK